MANIRRRMGVGGSPSSFEPDSIAVLDREERGSGPANAEEFDPAGVAESVDGTCCGVCPLIKGVAVLGLESIGPFPMDCESAGPIGDGTETVGDAKSDGSLPVALSTGA